MTEIIGTYNGKPVLLLEQLEPGDPDSVGLDEKIFICAAFRFGWLGRDVLILGAGGWDDMSDKARLYAQWRGGKYAAGVFANGDESFDNPLVYHPSSWGEEGPRLSARIWAAEHLGHRVLTTAELGKDYSGEPVTLPAWLQDAVDAAQRMGEIFAEKITKTAPEETPDEIDA